MTRRVYLAVQFLDGTGVLMSRDEFFAHDFIARPAALVRFVWVEGTACGWA